MPVAALSAAKRVCELSGWTLSPLAVQKILYLAHMVHLGRTGGAPLFAERFEARDIGPILPSVHGHLRCFGARPAGNLFHSIQDVEDVVAGALLHEAVACLGGLSPAKLVAMTCRPGGAWARHYAPAANRWILDTELLAEYRARLN